MKSGIGRGYCCEAYCRNLRRKDRRRCHMHDTRRKRKAHPFRYAWHNLKGHAKARRIPFRLPFEVFRKFAIATEYLTRTGNHAGAVTVDRINNKRGYDSKNIQPLSRSENAIKRAKSDAIRYGQGMKWQEKINGTNGQN